ncbi:hypothetical protein [Cellulomonas sp. NS3]|uniref:hypothetical protein n=1 Tax=Cellulomonas sp. NS3 TaxID=2973977 RepID=UPI002162A263|nr:hypothetical protein [Cellulomonas sp. NS3]
MLDATTGGPLQGVTASLWAMADEGVEAPVATLTSDAAGYLSFCAPAHVRAQLGFVVRFHETGIETLLGEGTDLSGLAFITSLSAPDARRAARLPSIQEPDLLDLRLSPRSFAVSPSSATTHDGCITAVQSQAPERDLEYARVVLGADEGPQLLAGRHHALDVTSDAGSFPAGQLAPRGSVLHLRQTWSYLGNSLGDILYSLPLAPGESALLATIDWNRADRVQRGDDLRAFERLSHGLTHDRTLDETVTASLDELQGGFSLMGGASHASNGGGAVDLSSIIGFPLKVAGGTGDVMGMAGAVAVSGGRRDVQADSMQQLSESVAQAASALRTLNSTVVVQGEQSETSTLQTRAVSNNNRCHTLTIQYYELLRTFRVETWVDRVEEVVLLPFAAIPFGIEENVLRFRSALEAVLLDQRMRAGFDAVTRLLDAPEIYETEPMTPTVPTTSYATGRHAFHVDPTEVLDSQLLVQDGSTLRISATGNAKFGADLGSGYGPDGKTGSRADDGYPAPGKRELSLVCRVGNVWYQGGTQAQFVARDEGNLLLRPNDWKMDDNHGAGWDVTVVITPPATAVQPEPDPTAPARAGGPAAKKLDKAAAALLLRHLQSNAGYYSRAIWLLMDRGERRQRLESFLQHSPDLLGRIGDTPLAVLGSWVAFAVAGDAEIEVDPDRRTQLLALPSRGLVAEAELGHCNVCEKRDVTRAMDWPLPAPPQISGIEPGPQGQAPSTPTPAQLPPPVVAITQAPAVPDPSGLSAALQLLGKPDVFRDMSGLNQVSSLLDDLVSGAVSGAEAAMRAAGAQKEIEKVRSSASTPAAGGGAPGAPKEATPQQSPTERLANLQVAEEIARAADSMAWDRETKAAVTEQVVYPSAGSNGVQQVAAPGVALKGELMTFGWGLVKSQITQLVTGTSDVDLDVPGVSHALMARYRDPTVYVGVWPDHVVLEFDDVGGGMIGDGLSGAVSIRWTNSYLDASAVVPSDRWMTEILTVVPCMRDIRFTLDSWSVGKGVSKGRVTLDLVQRTDDLAVRMMRQVENHRLTGKLVPLFLADPIHVDLVIGVRLQGSVLGSSVAQDLVVRLRPVIGPHVVRRGVRGIYLDEAFPPKPVGPVEL